MISLATALVTLLGMWLVARKDWRGWAVGLANQALWLWLIVDTHAWGLLLLTVSLSVIYTKALITWRRDARRQGMHAPGFSGSAQEAALEQAEMLLGRWQDWSIDMGRPPTMPAAEWRGVQLRERRALQRRLYDECATTGWDPHRRNTLAEELAHIHEEVSEAFRAWRLYHDTDIHHGPDGRPEGVPIEFADVVIGLFYNAELHGFDLLEAVEIKHQWNLTRDYVAEGRQLHSEASS